MKAYKVTTIGLSSGVVRCYMIQARCKRDALRAVLNIRHDEPIRRMGAKRLTQEDLAKHIANGTLRVIKTSTDPIEAILRHKPSQQRGQL